MGWIENGPEWSALSGNLGHFLLYLGKLPDIMGFLLDQKWGKMDLCRGLDTFVEYDLWVFVGGRGI